MSNDATTETLTADYIEESMELVQTLLKEKEDLQAKVAELQEEKVLLEKVAEEKKEEEDPVFSQERVEEVVEKLVKLSYISPLYSKEVVAKISEEPSTVLSLLEKISEASMTPHSGGVGIAKESSEAELDVDPDGWLQLRK